MGRAVDELYSALASQGYGLRLMRGEPLAQHTSFSIGGPSDLYVEATTPEEIEELARTGWSRNVPVFVLGGGTNILVADAGLRGLTIANRSSRMTIREDGVAVAESGVRLSTLAKETVRLGWAGLEWAVGIPGTVDINLFTDR